MKKQKRMNIYVSTKRYYLLFFSFVIKFLKERDSSFHNFFIYKFLPNFIIYLKYICN